MPNVSHMRSSVMIPIPQRKTLIFLCIAAAFGASILYDTVFAVYSASRLRPLLAAGMLASLGVAFLLENYPLRVIKPWIVATWPLHVFTVFFIYLDLTFHGRASFGQVIAYTLVAYATYAVLPLLLVLDRRLFHAFVRLIAVLSALLAIPSYFGAMGFTSVLGIPLSGKPFYARFSGIVASGGVFEHGEGHALQMAAGMLCCIYLVFKPGGNTLARSGFFCCFCLSAAGLVISQGRAAILGIAIAVAFSLLPELFRRSRPLFFGSLALTLVFPFGILPQLSAIPRVGRYLRLESGLSGREDAWEYAQTLVREKPWTGHGFLASSRLTELNEKNLGKDSGYKGAGTTFHNTFVTKAVDLGLVATFLYSLLYVIPLSRICAPSEFPWEQHLVRTMILLTLTTAIFRDYNIGGVRSTTVMGTVFLGMASLWPRLLLWRPELTVAAAAEPLEEGLLPARTSV